LRLRIGRINGTHGGQRRRNSATARTGAACYRRRGGRATHPAHATSGAGILRADPADALDQAPRFDRRALGIKRLAYLCLGLRLMNFRMMHGRLLRDMHRTSTHDRTPTSAGAKFCKSHFYRHNTISCLAVDPVSTSTRSISTFHRADKIWPRK
jgi:hypothetical protein